MNPDLTGSKPPTNHKEWAQVLHGLNDHGLQAAYMSLFFALNRLR